jgi:hypothetical protein
MNDEQWKNLPAVLHGDLLRPIPCGFIIFSPWLPGWYGIDIAECLSSETLWFDANRKVIEMFPDVWFLPGCWKNCFRS